MPCALAAARCGAKVVLCQDRSVLGGNASSEVRMHIVGANGTGGFDRGEEGSTEAREGGIIEEIRLENCVRNPQRSASMFDLILYEKCRAEPNLTLMLNTTVSGVTMDGDRIAEAIAERPSTEDRYVIQAKIFVDCTGDGRLGVEAGAPFMEGRESREKFGETLGLGRADTHRLGSTILIQARRHEQPMPFIAPPWARKFSKDDLRLRLYANPGEEEPTHEYGYWWAEWGGTLDTIKDNEAIRDELLAIVMGIWDHVKNVRGGAEHWALDWFGFLPGKRESRRFIGQHVLTEQDVMQSREFPDAIAYGGWSIDLHPPEGVDAPDEEPCVQHPVPHLYDIPLRSCVSGKISNLMFAGRNLSATHVAFASTRVMATCAVVGQGVGTAAVHAIGADLSPSCLAENTDAMDSIQQQLLKDDAFLIGRVRRADLGAQATIRASSEQPGAEAGLVAIGQTRSVHGKRGAPPDRANPGSHRWMSDPAEGLPAWIEFEWRSPATIREIQLIFDVGMHRHLTLSHHDGYTSKMLWGQTQSESVRSFTITGFDAECRQQLLVEETANHQRLCRYPVAPETPISKLRITVHETNGLDHARIFEVRIT